MKDSAENCMKYFMLWIDVTGLTYCSDGNITYLQNKKSGAINILGILRFIDYIYKKVNKPKWECYHL